MTLRGRPPFLPLRREAAVFFGDVALPPKAPRAWAAGFFGVERPMLLGHLMPDADGLDLELVTGWIEYANDAF